VIWLIMDVFMTSMVGLIADTYKSSVLSLIVLSTLKVMEQNPWGNVEAYNLEYLGIWSHILIMGCTCGLNKFWITYP
jgi:hypothetical protein